MSPALATAIDALWRSQLVDVPVCSWQVRLNDRVLTEHELDRRFSGASMIKTPIAAVVVDDVTAGHRSWRDDVVVTEEMRAPGDGLLRSLQLPRRVSLDVALTLMIAVSDNTATNALIDALGGLDVLNERMAAQGWSSRARRWIGGQRVANGSEGFIEDDGLPSPAGLSRISLVDHQSALARILASDDPIVRAFTVQQDRRALARWVSDDVCFAHKSGTIDGVRHDAGVLLGSHGELWVACFTDGGAEDEFVDHPSCVAMGAAMRGTLRVLGLGEYLVGQDI